MLSAQFPWICPEAHLPAESPLIKEPCPSQFRGSFLSFCLHGHRFLPVPSASLWACPLNSLLHRVTKCAGICVSVYSFDGCLSFSLWDNSTTCVASWLKLLVVFLNQMRFLDSWCNRRFLFKPGNSGSYVCYCPGYYFKPVSLASFDPDMAGKKHFPSCCCRWRWKPGFPWLSAYAQQGRGSSWLLFFMLIFPQASGAPPQMKRKEEIPLLHYAGKPHCHWATRKILAPPSIDIPFFTKPPGALGCLVTTQWERTP